MTGNSINLNGLVYQKGGGVNLRGRYHIQKSHFVTSWLQMHVTSARSPSTPLLFELYCAPINTMKCNAKFL